MDSTPKLYGSLQVLSTKSLEPKSSTGTYLSKYVTSINSSTKVKQSNNNQTDIFLVDDANKRVDNGDFKVTLPEAQVEKQQDNTINNRIIAGRLLFMCSYIAIFITAVYTKETDDSTAGRNAMHAFTAMVVFALACMTYAVCKKDTSNTNDNQVDLRPQNNLEPVDVERNTGINPADIETTRL